MVGKVVTKTGATMWTRGKVYKEIMKLVFLYRSESWVVMGDMLKLL